MEMQVDFDNFVDFDYFVEMKFVEDSDSSFLVDSPPKWKQELLLQLLWKFDL